jgi:hypothetical protein
MDELQQHEKINHKLQSIFDDVLIELKVKEL